MTPVIDLIESTLLAGLKCTCTPTHVIHKEVFT
jgi:hypothetical protein